MTISGYTPMALRSSASPSAARAGVYEEKVDGWGIVAYKNSDRVRLLSRHCVDHTRRFPDIAAAIAKLSACTLVLDGEVAIFDNQAAAPAPGPRGSPVSPDEL